MKEILQNENLKPPQIGKIVEGTVLGQKRGALFLDLGALGTGIIYGREFFQNKEKLEKLKPGDKLLAKIVEVDNEEGYVELSITNASKELEFEILKRKKEAGEIFEVKILKANRGGLITEISGIPAFLPVSQLLPEHYPKVEDGNPTQILKELQKFVGKEMKVKILNLSTEKKQIILCEAKEEKGLEDLLGKETEGEVSGILSFGILVKIGELEGLIPQSENNLSKNFKIGESVKVKVTEIKDGKILLSLI
jgi:small subunit ribosomal protein S1